MVLRHLRAVKIIRMKKGQAPTSADRIYITRRRDGTACWNGAVGLRGGVFGYSTSDRQSVAEAEAEAINWAQANGASEIIIEDGEA